MNLEKKIMGINYEEMLFRYGLSCAENLEILKKITKEDYDKLLDYARKKIVPNRVFLEKVFSEAVKRIGEEKTAEAVERYFLEKHNSIINNREGNYAKLWEISPDRCLECMTGKAVIIEVNHEMGVPVFNVKYESGKTDIVIGTYLWDDVNVGDTIIVHNKSAVRKYET